jgi:hypothetical protein
MASSRLLMAKIGVINFTADGRAIKVTKTYLKMYGTLVMRFALERSVLSP